MTPTGRALASDPDEAPEERLWRSLPDQGVMDKAADVLARRAVAAAERARREAEASRDVTERGAGVGITGILNFA